MDKSSTHHAVMVSSPGMGHLIPVVELANRLSSLHSFKVTILYVATAAHADDHRARSSASVGVELLEIPAADISSIIDPDAQVVTKFCVLMRETGPAVRAAMSGLTAPKPTVAIFDMFATEYVSMGRELGVPSFVYVTSSAWFLALTVRCPGLDKEVQGEYVDQTEPFHIMAGCRPVRPDEVVDPMTQRADPQYKEYLRIGAEIPLFDGVLCNTWRDLEGPTLAALGLDGSVLRKPVYEVGPIVRTEVGGGGGDAIVEWLDRQPEHSVVYVSFGSGGTLSVAQMAELALGLELSRQRFIWVVRPPPSADGDASGSYLGSKGDSDRVNIDKFLPHGFVERTRARDSGLLVPQWGPQMKILAHGSIGGFLTHCGWNSILESVTMGVPMIAWPMYAEQRMNATMLVEELEVAVRPSHLPGKKVVGRDEIEKMVRVVLEGDEGRCMRVKAQALQRAAAQALNQGGSSYKRLSMFVQSI